VIAVIAVMATRHSTPATSATANQPVDTDTVQRGPLATAVSGAGILTYRAGSDGRPVAVVNRASGIFTALPGRGDKVGCGDLFYRVDDRPVLLLCGATPAYRDLHVGDAGADVRELNQNLHQLGDDAGVEIDPTDDHFTSNTAAALEALQTNQGLDATGTLGLADAVFLPWSVNVADVSADVGGTAEPGNVVMHVTSDTLEVQIQLDATEQEAISAGDAAQITLPSNTSTAGKVDRIGRIAATPQGPDASDGGATIGAYISLDHPDDTRGLDKAPVQVEITTTR